MSDTPSIRVYLAVCTQKEPGDEYAELADWFRTEGAIRIADAAWVFTNRRSSRALCERIVADSGPADTVLVVDITDAPWDSRDIPKAAVDMIRRDGIAPDE